MKKLIAVILLLAMLSLLFIGCIEPNSEYTINVTGSDGLEFSGSYMVVSTNGASKYEPVDATVPATYKFMGNVVTIDFQKKVTGGTLKVEIIKNGNVVNTSETTAEYGIIKTSG
jgi:hypothetical protein